MGASIWNLTFDGPIFFHSPVLDKSGILHNNIFMKKGTIIISTGGVLALAGLFIHWWVSSPGISPLGRIAAVFSAALFGAVCLRFVPGWMAFWSEADAAPGAPEEEPNHMLPKLFFAFLLFDLCILLVAGILRRLWGYTDGLAFWTCTDSQHYLDIARDWYLSEGEWDRLVQLVFLPGYPVAVRLAQFAVPDTLAAGLTVSALCFAGAGCVCYRLARLDMPHEGALRVLKYLCLLPGAFFFPAPMSESLFLLLCVSCLYCARKGHWLLAGILGGLAAFTRSLGLMLVVPLFFLWVHNRKRLSLRRLAAVLMVPLGFAAYCFINNQVSGNPFQFMEYQSVHWGQQLGWFWNTAAYQTEWAMRTLGTPDFWGLWLPNLLYGFGSLILMLFAVKRLRVEYSAWFLAYYFIAVGATWLLSAPRYLIAMPAVSMAMAAVTQNRRADAVLTVLCGIFSILYFCAFLLRWQVW